MGAHADMMVRMRTATDGTRSKRPADGSRHRDRRRAAAEARQAERNARTDADQLALIRRRPGTSARESLRLAERIAARGVVV